MSGQSAIKQQPADDLVDCVVSTDVFAQHEDRPVLVERRGPVYGAGSREQLLLAARGIADLHEQLGFEMQRVMKRMNAGPQIVDRLGPTQTTRRTHRADPRARLTPTTGLDRHRVVRRLGGSPGRAIANRFDNIVADLAIGETETGGELEVVTRRAHRRGNGRVVDTNRHRFFDDQLVRVPRRRHTVTPLLYEVPELGGPARNRG